MAINFIVDNTPYFDWTTDQILYTFQPTMVMDGTDRLHAIMTVPMGGIISVLQITRIHSQSVCPRLVTNSYGVMQGIGMHPLGH